VINDEQTITKDSLGKLESDLLTQLGPLDTFTPADAARLLSPEQGRHIWQALARLRAKGWIERIRPGVYAVVPLSSGTDRTPQLHEFLIAMKLVQPAAIAYLSALSHHGMTEQLPALVYVATNHRVARPARKALAMSFRIVAQRPQRFFGLRQEWIHERPFTITDPEKTLVDGLTLPEYVGGVGTVLQALSQYWDRLDEDRLYDYALRLGVSAVVKRLGLLLETVQLGHPERLRELGRLAAGFPSLDPTLPARGVHNRRWGLLVNANLV
jgi:predicted transcriptional regulator of viral defense system